MTSTGIPVTMKHPNVGTYRLNTLRQRVDQHRAEATASRDAFKSQIGQHADGVCTAPERTGVDL
jgi:hypothetical protein